jgi:uncharacterized protein YkwD
MRRMQIPVRLVPTLLSVVTTAALLVLPAAPTVSAATTVSQAEAKLVALLNNDRSTRGIRTVTIDTRLMSIARARSTDMARKHYFSHTQPDGRTAFTMMSAAGVRSSRSAETIAYNYTTDLGSSATGCNTQWMNSSGHRAIILTSAYTHVGVGVAIDSSNGRRYWTAVWAAET